MSNEVLVKRLHVALLRRQTQDSWTWGEQQHLVDALSDAITALSQPTYDDGLEAAAQWHDAEAVRCLDEATFCEREGMPACKALHEESAQEHLHSAECIRALKRPTAEPVKEDRRIGPEDRRNSACGDARGAPGWQGRREGPYHYGRRSGDRTRWTAQAEPVDVPTFLQRTPEHYARPGEDPAQPSPTAQPTLTLREEYSRECQYVASVGGPVLQQDLALALDIIDRRLAAMGGK